MQPDLGGHLWWHLLFWHPSTALVILCIMFMFLLWRLNFFFCFPNPNPNSNPNPNASDAASAVFLRTVDKALSLDKSIGTDSPFIPFDSFHWIVIITKIYTNIYTECYRHWSLHWQLSNHCLCTISVRIRPCWSIRVEVTLMLVMESLETLYHLKIVLRVFLLYWSRLGSWGLLSWSWSRSWQWLSRSWS